MNKRGGLQFGLNAIVSFIIAMVIFGFGIYFVFTIFEASTLDAPDRCAAQLEAAIRQNEVFAICPSTVELSRGQLSAGFTVLYTYTNLDSDESRFFIRDLPSQVDYELIASPVDVPENAARIGTIILRSPDPDSVDPTTTLRIEICPEGPCDDDNVLASRTLMVRATN